MDNKLFELIDKVDEIEKEFHVVGDSAMMPTVEMISDSELYQEWIQAIQFELIQLLRNRDDEFIKDLLEELKKKPNGWRDKKEFQEIKSKLKVLKNNKSNYTEVSKVNNPEKELKVFVSHSSEDIEYVRPIVDLLCDMGLTEENLFCSSYPGYGIPNDVLILDYLRDLFETYDLHVIIVHSNHYYKSPICLNEMGAAWILKKECSSILLPGFGFSDMKGAVNSDRISIKLDSDIFEVRDRLNKLYDTITNEFGIARRNQTIWEQKRENFIEKITPKEECGLSKNAIDILIEAEKDKQGQILVVSDLQGTVIQAGKTPMNDSDDHKGAEIMKLALNELENNCYIERKNSRRTVFQISGEGYIFLQKYNGNMR